MPKSSPRRDAQHFDPRLSTAERDIVSRIEKAPEPIGPESREERAQFNSAWVKSSGRIRRSASRSTLGGYVYYLRPEESE